MRYSYFQKITFLSSLFLLLFHHEIYSQTDSTEKKEPGEFKFNGYVDFNYFKNLNNPRSGNNTGASGFARAFDQKENQFQLGLVQTKTSYSRKKSDVVVDLVFGPHADLGNYGNVIGPFGAGKGTTSLAIKQAYFNYRFTKKLTFTAGQFGTHVGFEVIDAPLNYNYSLNNLFNNGPFYHIGVKATYAITSKINLMAGIVNNWDNLYDNNKFKTAIAQLSIIPNDKISVYLNYVGGDETTQSYFNKGDSLKMFKQLLDLVVTCQLTKKFYIGINAVGGSSSGLGVKPGDTTLKLTKITNNWGGVALYANYQLCKLFGLGVRGEFFDNTAGVMYIGPTDVQSITVTGRFSFDDDHMFIKPEFRIDTYKKLEYTGPASGNIQQFEDSDGNYTKNSQITAGLAFIYKF